ncbi:PREDICTED: uncharacterized protein LOC109310336 [Crocodylus porosus]|uniref:uncharacterized protein LOC109310336 n=1 Tax=Crocodylus porosus TaxID=8502 RepID=UPI00093C14CB|nr:PREDICTED: uncharacterized protein LOC109310336 [Crocodylus porosus]
MAGAGPAAAAQPNQRESCALRLASPRLSRSQAQVRRLLDGNRSRAPCHRLQLSSCANPRHVSSSAGGAGGRGWPQGASGPTGTAPAWLGLHLPGAPLPASPAPTLAGSLIGCRLSRLLSVSRSLVAPAVAREVGECGSRSGAEALRADPDWPSPRRPGPAHRVQMSKSSKIPNGKDDTSNPFYWGCLKYRKETSQKARMCAAIFNNVKLHSKVMTRSFPR